MDVSDALDSGPESLLLLRVLDRTGQERENEPSIERR